MTGTASVSGVVVVLGRLGAGACSASLSVSLLSQSWLAVVGEQPAANQAAVGEEDGPLVSGAPSANPGRLGRGREA